MAIAIASNSSVQSKSASGATTLTLSYDAGSASNRYLAVPVTDLSGDSVTGVTYAGVAMTQLCKVSRGPNNIGSLQTYWYGIHAPTTGTNDIVVTRTGTAAWIEVGAILLTDAQQTTPASVTVVKQGDTVGGSKSQAITTTVDNSAILGFVVNDNGSLAASTGITQLFIGAAAGFGNGLMAVKSSTFPYTPAGALTANWTQNATGAWSVMLISIAPSVATSNSRFFAFM